MIDWHTISYVLRHDPLPVVGFLMIGASSVLGFHIQSAMAKVGYKVHFFNASRDLGLPVEYLKVRSRHGWSPWPAYLIWPCLVLGVAFLITGLAFGG